MPRSSTHKRAQSKAAGRAGRTEAPLPSNRRLDAARRKTATEVELSGDPKRLKLAARRLRTSRKPQKVLQVPQRDMQKAAEAMKEVGTTGSVKNMAGTKRQFVGPRKGQGGQNG